MISVSSIPRAMVLGTWAFGLGVLTVSGNGVLRWGFGAADSGAAGVFGGTGGDSLSTMQLNPAALTSLQSSEWSLTGRALIGQGDFERSAGGTSLDRSLGAFPEAAIVWRLPEQPLWFGVSFAPISALQAEWNYLDIPAEGSGVSYGAVGHESGFLALKTNAALAWKINSQWSVGASLGAVYSRVDFDAPFIFQTNPALAGAKVDLDLETDGWALSWDVGVLYEPTESLSFGLRLRPEVELDNEGSAYADFSAQAPGLTDPFNNYDASSRNVLPLMVGVGFSWQATERLRVGGWGEWFHWKDSFDEFAVALSGGSNDEINGAIGTDSPDDGVPLEWEDRIVVAFGAEYRLNEQWLLRGGWRYGASPIPSNLVTPLNASISEHAVTLGLGWQREDWRIDASYAVEFGSKQKVGTSGYRAAEYSNSSVDLTVHSIGVGVTRSF
ncbi:OmpP1/FadL family transporter [Roseibacillus persicicus]|uniref:OmpP1/FadL family transporter n=1 Tax=Roseibacillus persicicus TaxID=454148 RepID=UPI00280D38F5|nr:outer membrane protein transport protein [Roseibacillus persicicus]MDQ8190278.1 outer membrane protein transport protein [Roseibacillus persicicus]